MEAKRDACGRQAAGGGPRMEGPTASGRPMRMRLRLRMRPPLALQQRQRQWRQLRPRARAEGRRPAGVAGTAAPAATAVVAACRMLRERRFFFTAAGELAEEIVTEACRSNGRNYFLLSWPNEKVRSGGSLTYRKIPLTALKRR